MNLGDLLNNLAAKIGAQNDQGLIDLLSSAELSQQEVSDELATRFDTGLMSLEGAKNNREVLNHLKPIILKSADEKFAELVDTFGLGDEIKAEPSTYKKFDILKTVLTAKKDELEKRASGNGGGEREKALTKQIADLQNQLATITAQKDKEIADFKAAAQKQELDFLVNFELNGKRYANPDLGDTNVEIARSLINKELANQKAVLVNENGQLKLKQAENPSLDFVDSGYKPVSFSDFTNRILADKHFLEVSPADPNPGGKGSPFYTPQQQTITLPGGKQVDTGNIDAAAAASIADLDN